MAGSGDGYRIRDFRARALKRFCRAWADLLRALPERLYVLLRTAFLLFSPEYSAAQYAVRKTARDPHMHDTNYWSEIGNRVARYPGFAENLFRNIEAGEWTRLVLKDRHQTARPHRIEAAVELAYVALKERGK